MLIVTTIHEQPEDFRLLAQNMRTFEVCGFTDLEGFEDKEVADIPSGFEQRVLPEHYGGFLTLPEITNLALIKNGEMKEVLDNSEQAIIELNEISESQDAAILELNDLIEGLVSR
jgi:hypothetical protein